MNEASLDVDPAANRKTGPWYSEHLDAMAQQLRRLHNAEARGDLAALRRMDPNHPAEPALFRMLAHAIPDKAFRDLDAVRPYAVATVAMAQRPEALGGSSLGSALYKVGVSEQRLSMFLNARGATLRDLVRRTARRLAASAEVPKLPYRELCALVLLDGREMYEPAAENIRIGIAADYQRAGFAADASGT